jgi:hypothetical protein
MEGLLIPGLFFALGWSFAGVFIFIYLMGPV